MGSHTHAAKQWAMSENFQTCASCLAVMLALKPAGGNKLHFKLCCCRCCLSSTKILSKSKISNLTSCRAWRSGRRSNAGYLIKRSSAACAGALLSRGHKRWTHGCCTNIDNSISSSSSKSSRNVSLPAITQQQQWWW